MTALGTITLWLSPLLAAWSILVGVIARGSGRQELAESSRRAALIQGLLLAITLVSLATAFVYRDFSLAYVADHSSRNLSVGFAVAAVTAGWQGALLLALFALSVTSIPRLRGQSHPSDRAAGVTSATILLGMGVLIAAGHPFARLPVTPLEGHGLDPRLHDFAFLLESPLRILGYATAGTAVLDMIGRGEGPRVRVRARWLLISWLLFATSLAVGLWHAYGWTDARGVADWGSARTVTESAWVAVSVLLLTARRGRIRLSSPQRILLLAGGILLLAGVLGWWQRPEREFRIKVGGNASFASLLGSSYTLNHMGVSRFETADRFVAAATLGVDRNGKSVGLVSSERRQYFDLLGQPIGEPVTKVGVRRGALEDLRVVYLESSGSEEALYRVQASPFAWLIWVGAGLLILGGLLLLPELDT